MGHYMSVDGGGTKIIAILFDENFNCLASGKSGPINPNFMMIESVEANMSTCIKECLTGREDMILDVVYVAMPGPMELLLDVIKRQASIIQAYPVSEGYMSILAGIQRQQGIVALSGTGSGVFGIDNERQTHLGGWGSLIGDEGSGYDVGRQGILAAIRGFDGRGPHTVLQEMIMEAWKLTNMWDIVPIVYGANITRDVIASCSLLVSRAAMKGDRAAQDIFVAAGEEMAHQVIALMRRDGFDECTWITAAGSVWKGHPLMFERFKQVVTIRYPGVTVAMPLFEPVMGGVVREAMCLGSADRVDETVLQRLIAQFGSFLYRTAWESTL